MRELFMFNLLIGAILFILEVTLQVINRINGTYTPGDLCDLFEKEEHKLKLKAFENNHPILFMTTLAFIIIVFLLTPVINILYAIEAAYKISKVYYDGCRRCVLFALIGYVCIAIICVVFGLNFYRWIAYTMGNIVLLFILTIIINVKNNIKSNIKSRYNKDVYVAILDSNNELKSVNLKYTHPILFLILSIALIKKEKYN